VFIQVISTRLGFNRGNANNLVYMEE